MNRSAKRAKTPSSHEPKAKSPAAPYFANVLQSLPQFGRELLSQLAPPPAEKRPPSDGKLYVNSLQIAKNCFFRQDHATRISLISSASKHTLTWMIEKPFVLPNSNTMAHGCLFEMDWSSILDLEIRYHQIRWEPPMIFLPVFLTLTDLPRMYWLISHPTSSRISRIQAPSRGISRLHQFWISHLSIHEFKMLLSSKHLCDVSEKSFQ